MGNIKMRIPTSKEWGKMMNICEESDTATHWVNMCSWVNDIENYLDLGSSLRACRGDYSARRWYCSYAASQYPFLGFRPAFENLVSDAQDGETVIIGTLYMGGEPVKVPTNPVRSGDVTKYIEGAKLEVREPLTDPAYQIKAIKVGDVFIADRVLLSKISYDQIFDAISANDSSKSFQEWCAGRRIVAAVPCSVTELAILFENMDMGTYDFSYMGCSLEELNEAQVRDGLLYIRYRLVE